MKETEVFIKTPVSEKPEKDGQYICKCHGMFKGEITEAYSWQWIEYRKGEFEQYSYVSEWLRPLSISEVPDEKRIGEIADEYQNIVGIDEAERVRFIHGMETMRKELLPHFALLKEENEKLKTRIEDLERIIQYP